MILKIAEAQPPEHWAINSGTELAYIYIYTYTSYIPIFPNLSWMNFICLWGLSSFDSICPEKGASFVATATADKEDLERGWSTDPKTCTADRQVTLCETNSSHLSGSHPKRKRSSSNHPVLGASCKLLVSRKGKSLLLNSDCDGKPQQMARPQVSGCCFSNSFCKMIIAVFEEDQTKRALDFTFLMKVRWRKRWPMANISAHLFECIRNRKYYGHCY